MKSSDITKEAVLQALLTAKNIKEAARIAGVSKKTIYLYLNNDPDFVLVYKNLKREQLQTISDNIADGAVYASEKMLDIVTSSGYMPPAVRLQACVKTLEHYAKFKNLAEGLNKDIEAQGEGEEESEA